MRPILFALFTAVSLPSFICAQSDALPSTQEVFAKAEAVMDPSRQVGNLDPGSAIQLPIGLVKNVNGTNYIIAIDSMRFTPLGAFFDAYMAIDPPGADRKLAFAAKNIRFNPKGVIGGDQAKLVLVSDQRVKMGPRLDMVLEGGGANYVEWDCNGFRSISLSGTFKLGGDRLVSAQEGVDTVEATFSIQCNDLHNFMVGVDFSPFMVRGLEDFVFTVDEAFVDFSDFHNPQGMPLPTFASDALGGAMELWRGFYLKRVEVGLPKAYSMEGSPRRSIYAVDLYIDESGLTGAFGAMNVLAMDEGDMSGWGFSIDQMEVNLTSNVLTGGLLRGGIRVKPLNEEVFDYSAAMSRNPQSGELDYAFSANPHGTVTLDAFGADLDLYPSTVLEVDVQGGKFVPRMVLNGKLHVEQSKLRLSHLGFERITLVTYEPYVTDGTFSLVGSQASDTANRVGKFPIALNSLTLGMYQGRPTLGADMTLNLSKRQGNIISVTGGFQVRSKILDTPSGKQWEYDTTTINKIAVNASTNAFSLHGEVEFIKSDPVFGDGFRGSLLIDSKLNDPKFMFTANAAFGKVDEYRYFTIDGALETPIPLGAITLTRIQGGLSNRMRSLRTPQQIHDDVAHNRIPANAMQEYVPDPSKGFIFRAGVGMQLTGNPKSFNSDVLFTISFNEHGGLDEVMFNGNAYMMVTREDRVNPSEMVQNEVAGTIAVLYDNQAKVLDARVSAAANFHDVIYATVDSKFYFSPGEWYIWINRPSDPATVSVVNIATVQGYFMVGQNLEPMMPPPPCVMSALGSVAPSRDAAEAASGNGFATGMRFQWQAGFDKPITDKWRVYADLGVAAGFDMMLRDYGLVARCSGINKPIGIKGWYLNGQLYAYVGGSIGARKVVDGEVRQELALLSMQFAAYLQGKLPSPSYVYGAVAFQATVLGIFNVNVNAKMEAGIDCQLVG